MKRDLIRALHENMNEYADKTVTLGGWVRSVRTSKDCGFIDLNDGSAHKGVQVVFERQFVSNFTEVGKLNVGAANCKTTYVTLLGVPECEKQVLEHTRLAKKALEKGSWLGDTEFLCWLADQLASRSN